MMSLSTATADPIVAQGVSLGQTMGSIAAVALGVAAAVYMLKQGWNFFRNIL